MIDVCNNCGREYKVRIASWEEPYHYVESGLSNVMLIEIPVYYCDSCEVETADIPNMEGLHDLIARDIILTPLPMTGAELRFLRKEISLKPQEFAELIGVDPKTITNWEKADTLSRQADITVRIMVTAKLWKPPAQTEILVELAELAKYAWESADEVEAEEPAQDIQQLAADNVAYGLNENHQWGIAA